MTEQIKGLSTQALNKITKSLYAGEGYESKSMERFLKAKKEFDEARRAVNDEIGLVMSKIDDDEENFTNTRAYKKLEGDERWTSIRHFDTARDVLYSASNQVGYSYEGYDSLADAWQSSSMRC